MSNKIPFTKMQGAGNDYIYVNTLLYSIPDPAKTAIAWSKPHFGIGSDGLVLIGKPYGGCDADYSMRIFNADGSEAMMCGNASRCIGKYLYDKKYTSSKTIRLQTLSGVKTLQLHTNADNKVQSVTVDMLEPATDVPEQYTAAATPNVEGLPEASKGTFVSMGNPHYVIFTDNVEKIDIAHFGSILERDEAFPQRCNIEFAQIIAPDTLRTRVWERGSGITLACGTGACATAVAAALTGRAHRASTIVMDGGKLEINWSEADNHVYMTGPAAFTFEGEAELPL